MGTRRKQLPVPRPGALAAKRRYLARTYEPRYQLCLGADPWQDGQGVNADGTLTPDEIASLGLALLPLRVD